MYRYEEPPSGLDAMESFRPDTLASTAGHEFGIRGMYV
jgi:hypothetical protein